QKQKKLIMLPSETMIWQPEFTDKTLSRKPGAVHTATLLFICSGQQKLVTISVFFQYLFSDSFGGNPPLYS
ncbi:hypothetical protein MTQ63_22355, partial [Escherichia coli]|nr:hypothetical protein [Escherichia coli]